MTAQVIELRPAAHFPTVVDGPKFWTTPDWADPRLSIGGEYLDFGDGDLTEISRYHETTLTAFTAEGADGDGPISVRVRLDRTDSSDGPGPTLVSLIVGTAPALLDDDQIDGLVAALQAARKF